jgi:Zn-dependent protease
MDELIRNIAVFALPVIFAITLHEAAHAYAAKFFGDNTAYSQGRMSLNPMNHIDPFGTIIIPVLLYLSGGFAFGYARPVPVEWSRLRHPRRDMAWVALAGPAANFVMALLWLVLAIFLNYFQVQEPFPHKVADAGVLTNLVILALNLIPILPLDGGRVLSALLPPRMAHKFARTEPYGFVILLVLIVMAHFGMNIIALWMSPIMSVAALVLQWITTPLTLLLS